MHTVGKNNREEGTSTRLTSQRQLPISYPSSQSVCPYVHILPMLNFFHES